MSMCLPLSPILLCMKNVGRLKLLGPSELLYYIRPEILMFHDKIDWTEYVHFIDLKLNYIAISICTVIYVVTNMFRLR